MKFLALAAGFSIILNNMGLYSSQERAIPDGVDIFSSALRELRPGSDMLVKSWYITMAFEKSRWIFASNFSTVEGLTEERNKAEQLGQHMEKNYSSLVFTSQVFASGKGTRYSDAEHGRLISLNES